MPHDGCSGLCASYPACECGGWRPRFVPDSLPDPAPERFWLNLLILTVFGYLAILPVLAVELWLLR